MRRWLLLLCTGRAGGVRRALRGGHVLDRPGRDSGRRVPELRRRLLFYGARAAHFRAMHPLRRGLVLDGGGHKQLGVLQPLCSREIFQRQWYDHLVLLYRLPGGYILERQGGHEFVQLHPVQLWSLRQPSRGRQLHLMRLRAVRDNLRGHCMHCLCSWDVPVWLGQRPPAFFSAGSAWLPGFDR